MTDYQKLTQQLEAASAGSVVSTALSSFGDDIAIAFSGSEDVLLIEFAKRSGLPFRVFTLDTGRLHPETYRYFATIEDFYRISIEYCFPDAEPVQSLVRKKGLFSFFADGHEECCRIRKVVPLRKHLSGLRSWITGQRRDQNPQTRQDIPVVHIDGQFSGLSGSELIKWNPLATMTSTEVWDYIRAFELPINPLHERGFISIGCEPCTRAITPGQHERDGRWWWEREDSKECGLHATPIPSHELAD